MTQFDQITSPQEMNLLVGFFDLTRFLKFVQQHNNQEVFEVLSAYFEFAGDIIEGSGGTIVKFLGDAGLVIYSANKVNDGVLALLSLKKDGDAWLADHHLPCRNKISAHFGPVVCGHLGTKTHKIFDIIGDTVNTAVMMNSGGLTLSTQVFRQLGSDTRKLFKKHTPPITYIPVDEPHRD